MNEGAELRVSLTPELRDLVEEAVSTGDYASAGDVVQAALQDWKQRRTSERLAAGELRKLWNEGIASGAAGPVGAERVKREGRRRLGAERGSAAD